MKNKVLLRVKKDKNGWYQFSKGKYRVQLCGDSRLGGFWLKQYATRLGKDEFMKDFSEILEQMANDNVTIFTMYELE